jgi:hypothetical protein
MAIESAVMMRKVARIACPLLVVGMLQGSAAVAQLPVSASAPVTVGSVIPFSHGATGVWNQVYSMKIAPTGDIIFLDSAASNLYQLAPGASEPTLLLGPTPGGASSTCSGMEAAGTYWNAAVAFDQWNNLYVTDRYGSAVQFCRAPYDSVHKTWDFGNNTIWAGPALVPAGGGPPLPINPQDITIGDNGTFYISGSNGGIYSFNVNEAGTVSNVTTILTNMEEYAAYIAVDHAGNLFFAENVYGSTLSTRVSGIREIPAGTTVPASQCTGNGACESALTRIDDPTAGFNCITGLFFDAHGNLFFSSIQNSGYDGNVSGVFMVPNEGTPTSPNLVWADSVMVTPVYAGHDVLVDPRGFLWVPTGGNSNWAPNGTNAPNCDQTNTTTEEETCTSSTVMIWKPGAVNFGQQPAASHGAVQIKSYSASKGILTLTANNSYQPNQAVTFTASGSDGLSALNGQGGYVLDTGLSSTSFQIDDPSAGGTAYVINGSGSSSATASATQSIFYVFSQSATPSTIALTKPTQNGFTIVGNPAPNTSLNPEVAPCTSGTVYPAFSGTEVTNSEYSWCTVFLEANPNSTGNVESELQLLDANNNVIAGSNTFLGGTGQGSAISLLSGSVSTSIASGLSAPKEVAVDSQGNIYVADSGLKAVERYAPGQSNAAGSVIVSGLKSPTGVTVDGAGNLYIGDSGSVIEIPNVNGALDTSAQTSLPLPAGNTLGNHLNLAADTYGDIFVADQDNKQVVEIPNAQTQLLVQGVPFPSWGTSSGFTNGPSAIGTDNSGDVYVADGGNLFEITMPFGGVTEISNGLSTPVTGVAVDSSGSVFVNEANGTWWIPFQTTSTGAGLNPNGVVQVTAGVGSGNAVIPFGLALDGSDNVYLTYGASSTAGLSELGIGSSVNFNASGAEINPNVPFEYDAQLYDLGNMPMTLQPFANDQISGSNPSVFSIAAATENSPACSPSTAVQPGYSCYVGLNIQDSTAEQDSATATILSNSLNATSGVSIAMTADVVTDLRPASSVSLAFANVSTTGCAGSTYPGCQTVTVTVSSTAGTPQGTVNLVVPGSGPSQSNQSAMLTAAGNVAVATFNFTNLSGGTYNVEATYTGYGTAGATQNTCSTPTCFAGNAAKGTITIAPATPSFTVGPPGTQGCLSYTANNCTPNPAYVTSWAGSIYVNQASATFITAVVTSSVGTPTGSVSFLGPNGQPVDPQQPGNQIDPTTGEATFSLVNLPLGVYNITAVYNGDQNYAKQSVTLGTIEVIVPSVQITASPASVSVAAGSPVTITLTLMPLVQFAGQVALECVSPNAPVPGTNTLPPFSECTFAYPNSGSGNINVGGNGLTPSTIVVTLNTNIPVNGGTTNSSLAKRAPWSLAGLFGLGMVGLIAGRKRLHRSLSLICLALMLSGAFLSITSCTNAGYSSPPQAPNVTTPTGSYNVQIITYSQASLEQTSLTAPVFNLPVQVTAAAN